MIIPMIKIPFIRAGARLPAQTRLHEAHQTIHFYRASSYTGAVLGVVILSVRPSITRVLYDKTKQCTADILIPHVRVIALLS